MRTFFGEGQWFFFLLYFPAYFFYDVAHNQRYKNGKFFCFFTNSELWFHWTATLGKLSFLTKSQTFYFSNHFPFFTLFYLQFLETLHEENAVEEDSLCIDQFEASKFPFRPHPGIWTFENSRPEKKIKKKDKINGIQCIYSYFHNVRKTSYLIGDIRLTSWGKFFTL